MEPRRDRVESDLVTGLTTGTFQNMATVRLGERRELVLFATGSAADSARFVPLSRGLRPVALAVLARAIHLAFLAPDIVQRIVGGDHPVGPNADRLISLVALPVDWDAQRTLLGLAG